MSEVESNSVLLVLGMHRSGTSAVTGVLHLLGMQLGDRLLPADQAINPKGYWENSLVNQCHENFLGCLGSGWYDALPYPEDWFRRESVEPYVRELDSVISSQFGNLASWAVKDPRLCRMLPVWRHLLGQRAFAAKCLLMIRHPLEVAESLKQRDGIEQYHALSLWMRYVLDSELESRWLPRAILTYDRLMDDWIETMTYLGAVLGLNLHLGEAQAAAAVDGFLDEQLRHYQSISVDDSTNPLLHLALRAYDAVRHDDRPAIDIIRREFEDLSRANLSWLMQINHMMQTVYAQRKNIKQLECDQAVLHQKVERLENEVTRVKTSLSWVVTKPLRGLQNLLVRLIRRG